jgi:hypothetical protein
MGKNSRLEEGIPACQINAFRWKFTEKKQNHANLPVISI